MDDQSLERYSRQLLMPAFDVAGQERLLASRVLVVGAGGLGCPLVLYLAAAGVGEIRVCDPDQVELANLQRQVAFTTADIGRDKARVLCERARAVNPGVRAEPEVRLLTDDNLPELVSAADLVIDATDNFTIRFALNRSCVAAATPLLSGSAIRAEGQVALFWPAGGEGGCYHCLYPDLDEPSLSCSEAGVLGPLVGMIGTVQAMEAVKWLAGIGEPLLGRLLLLDALAMRWREMRLPADPACPVCQPRQGLNTR